MKRNSLLNAALMLATGFGTSLGTAMRAFKTPDQQNTTIQPQQRHNKSSKKSRGVSNGGRPMFKYNRRRQLKT